MHNSQYVIRNDVFTFAYPQKLLYFCTVKAYAEDYVVGSAEALRCDCRTC